MITPINELLAKLRNNLYGAIYSDEFGLGVQLGGFSKSGTATLFINPTDNGFCPPQYILESRYDRIDYIETYDDIVRVAYSWYSDYKSRKDYSEPPHQWVEDFVRLGYLKTKTITVYEPA